MIVATLDVRYKPEAVTQARELMSKVLAESRQFDGCLGITFLADESDETHHLLVEWWESVGHHEAYRAYRAGDGAVPGMAEVLAGAPAMTRYEIL